MERFVPGETFRITEEGEDAALESLYERTKELPEFEFVSALNRAKPESRVALVGGIVRDALLGRENPDYDFVFEGIGLEELMQILKEHGRVTDVSGHNFGVIKFTPEGKKRQFDISIPRTERYIQGMRRSDAEVKTVNVTLEDDFMRRDFTINAIGILLNKVISIPPLAEEKSTAYGNSKISHSACLPARQVRDDDIVNGNNIIFDPFDGKSDIKNRIIRAVGNPEERFKEDPTRILRAVRFACRLGFGIEAETFSAMKKLRGEILTKFEKEDGIKLQRVANEMIGTEIAKSIEGDPVKFLDLFDKLGLLPELLPEIEDLKGVEQPPQWHSEGDTFEHTRMILTHIPTDSSLEVKLAALLHDIGKADTQEPVVRTRPPARRAAWLGEDSGLRTETIHFYGHEKVSAEKAGALLRRYRFNNSLIENVSWLIENHMKMMVFPKMRISKQKEMARNPLFSTLMELARADTKSSLRPDGGAETEFLVKAEEVLAKIREEEKAGKPREILNGDEIIELLKQEKPDFDIEKEGRLIGELKRKVNEEYDEGNITNKKEARDWLRSNV